MRPEISSRAEPGTWWEFPGGGSWLALPNRAMSRAFVNEDAGAGGPKRDYHLPERDDPDFDAVAARVLLEAARTGETASAEDATGYRWGEPTLAPFVKRILTAAQAEGDDRLEQLARRFLR
jgi:hypothetical protein